MFADLLVQLGVLRPEGLEAAAKRQQKTGEDLEEAILAMQLCSERELLRAVARKLGCQYLTTEKVADLKIPDAVLEQVPVRVSEALAVMPFRLNPDGTLWVLAAAPLSAEQTEQLRRLSEARAISQILARRRGIRAALRKHYYRDPHAFLEMEEQELIARLAPPVAEAPEETPSESDEEQVITRVAVKSPLDDSTTNPRGVNSLSEELLLLQQENERLRVAHSLASAVATVHQLDVLSTELLAAMLDLSAAEAVGFALTGENGAPLLLESRRRHEESQTTLAISSSIVRSVVNAGRPLLILDAQADERFSREESVVTRRVRSVVCAPIISRAKVYGALYLEAYSVSSFDGGDLEQLALIGKVAGSAVENALSRQKFEDEVVTRHSLRRFLPAEVVERGLTGEGASLLPLRTEATLLVACLPDFAAFAADGEPDEVMRRIDGLIDQLTLPVFEYGGTLQGELRGGISAVFGHPQGEAEHEERAILAAVELAKRAGRGEAQGQLLSIGIATGPMVVGAVGPLSRLQFLATGEAAELAFSLARQARPGQILVSAATHERANRFLSWEAVADPVVQRGEPRPVHSLRWR